MTLNGAPVEQGIGILSMIAGGIGMFVFFLALFALMTVAMCKIYMKAGREWWEAIVPIYNVVIFFKIINKSCWNMLLFCIPIVNFIFAIIFMNRLSKKFGYESGFTVGLLFLPIIFFPILAWGDSVYIKEEGQQGVATEAGVGMPAAPVVETPMTPPVVEQTQTEPPAPPSM